jgi:hypothetical protein
MLSGSAGAGQRQASVEHRHRGKGPGCRHSPQSVKAHESTANVLRGFPSIFFGMRSDVADAASGFASVRTNLGLADVATVDALITAGIASSGAVRPRLVVGKRGVRLSARPAGTPDAFRALRPAVPCQCAARAPDAGPATAKTVSHELTTSPLLLVLSRCTRSPKSAAPEACVVYVDNDRCKPGKPVEKIV